MFVLAHLSDPHLGPIPRPRLSELASKRALGFFNWQWRRHVVHRAEVLAAIVTDVKAAEPDHIAVTGDLVNIALEREFAPALAWLDRLGTSERVTLVPGNHDAYVRATARHAERCWNAYMRGDSAAAGPEFSPFPFVRRRGSLALVGVSTALPTAPLLATGRLGPAQMSQLAATLAQLKDEGTFRIVLIHHPPAGERAWHKRFTDAESFLRVLNEHGADLVVHGHDHVHSLNWLAGPSGRIPAIGVPSASAAPSADEDAAGYNLYRIEGRPGAWRCEMVSRGLRRGDDGIVELNRQVLIG
jgi:3',5'-cyclic AMP phosphodiesterase CpdA